MGQYAWVIDILLLLTIGAITWVVSSEGFWGATLMFVNVMFAGLIAFDLYEPSARMIDQTFDVNFIRSISDFFSLVVIFSLAFTVLRLATDNIGPNLVRFPAALEQIGRYVIGAATAWYLAGMILCLMETAPIHKQFLGYKWDKHAFWTVGVDRFWLGYVQTTTERVFDRSPPRGFDATGKFIRAYHDHRPFGAPDPDFAPPAAAGAAGQPGQPAGGAAPGGAAPGAAAPAAGAGRGPATPAGVVGVTTQ